MKKIRLMGGARYQSIKDAGYIEKVMKDRAWLIKEFPAYTISFEVFDISEWDSAGIGYEVKTEIEIKRENIVSLTIPHCTLNVDEVEKLIERIVSDNPSTV